MRSLPEEVRSEELKAERGGRTHEREAEYERDARLFHSIMEEAENAREDGERNDNDGGDLVRADEFEIAHPDVRAQKRQGERNQAEGDNDSCESPREIFVSGC